MFSDRIEAGRLLAERVAELAPEDPVVLALPRGGVPVAAEVARRLGAALDLILVRKIGVPGHEELAAGAVADGGAAEAVYNEEVLRGLGLSREDLAATLEARLAEIGERRQRYLEGRAPVDVAGRTAIVVDDGIATGATVKAALQALALRRPKRTILAVPVAPKDSLAALRGLVDDLICLETPDPYYAVGAQYRDFSQTSDDEVIATLRDFAGQA